ncbi:uncharacterized protein BYT42DRAFT_403200 [Radiomyces spectabilis]|uniref:uncharacterized protein n=1 Tax=Radiomyces spectabilis TaxID=64574 RepID=UPI00221EE958|nr:uncharacterized protein BYT42DRAFT_403200 [Radiomyces spectabilis]KAI8374414.1 hypothetical protein BYT42DRAFT_403200 [Radiomyces spectabilis]
MVRVLSTSIAMSLVTLLATSAQGHIMMSPYRGQSINGTLTIGHGCSGAATTGLAVTVPENVVDLQPREIPNWKLDVVYRDLEKPITVNGKSINRAVANVTWSGGNLPNDQAQEFGILFTVPEVDLSNQPNVTLYFPSIQTCTNATSAYVDIPGSTPANGAKPLPAPSFTITKDAAPPTADNGHGDHKEGDGHQHGSSASSILVNAVPLMAPLLVSGALVLTQL